ncbi:MAG: hypothetical protein JWQ09_2879 [Segetibacter sp.]|nr:hypothetical protein [Segetibacter sp.]
MKTKKQLLVLMTKKVLILLASTLLGHVVAAQDSLHFKRAFYKATVSTISSSPPIAKGYLNALSDSSISLSPAAVRFNGYENNSRGLPAYHYNDISEVRLKRTGGAGRGSLIGAITGGLLGTLVGFASGDDKPTNDFLGCIFCLTAGQKALGAGVALGGVGGLIGSIIGALVHKTFIIKNNKEKFDELKWSLMH